METTETKIIGIYKISIKNHIYIGQSKDINKRLKDHLRDLKQGKHGNSFLQNVYEKYRDKTEFKIKTEILHTISPDKDKENQTKTLSVLEQFYINHYKADLNMAPAFPNGVKKIKPEEDKPKRLTDIYKKENDEKGYTLFHPTKGKLKISNLKRFCIENNVEKKDILDILRGVKSQSKGYFKSEELFKLYQKEALDLDEGTQSVLPTYDIEEINSCIEEALGFNPDFNLTNLPVLSGDLTSQVFIKWLENKNPIIMGALANISTAITQEGRRKLDNLPKQEVYDFILNQPIKEGFIHGLGAGSVPAFFPGNYDRNGGSPYGAVVHGGRTIREERSKVEFLDVLDIDLKSAYGTQLNRFDYPIGLPSVVSVSGNTLNKTILLKDLLDIYEDDLVKNLYVIYVSGKIKFPQDLIISKYGLSLETIGSRLLIGSYEDNDDTFKGRLGGEVVLCSHEIELGVLTSDVIEILRKVCNNAEWKEFLNLEVELLVYYPKSKELTLKNWCYKYNDEKKLGIYEDNDQIDHRTKEWCRFSLEDFLSPLYKHRLLCKELSKTDIQYKSKDKLVKLLLNAVYGDLASPYFPMGNTIVANNITAKVRCLSWMMAKALRTKLTVTDGGFYEYKSVNSLKGYLTSFRKPGIEKLFYQKESRHLQLKPLLPSFDHNSTTQKEIDLYAKRHLDEFWAVYDLEFDSDIEHKFENSSIVAIINPFSKVDYFLRTYWEKDVWRMRGIRENQLSIHPKAEVIIALFEGRNRKFQIAELVEVLGLNQYLKRIDKKILPSHTVKLTFKYFPNKDTCKIPKNYECYKKTLEAHRKRVANYLKIYKGLDLIFAPLFEG